MINFRIFFKPVFSCFNIQCIQIHDPFKWIITIIRYITHLAAFIGQAKFFCSGSFNFAVFIQYAVQVIDCHSVRSCPFIECPVRLRIRIKFHLVTCRCRISDISRCFCICFSVIIQNIFVTTVPVAPVHIVANFQIGCWKCDTSSNWVYSCSILRFIDISHIADKARLFDVGFCGRLGFSC